MIHIRELTAVWFISSIDVRYLKKKNSFIGSGAQQGRVLVHCKQGVSRSAAVVLAHLVLSGIPLPEALRRVRCRRSVSPLVIATTCIACVMFAWQISSGQTSSFTYGPYYDTK